jgi:hypothetical protein
MATLRSAKLVRRAPPPHHAMLLTFDSDGKPRWLLSVRYPSLQAQSARARQGPQVASEGLCADSKERPHDPHQHLVRCRSRQITRERRCATRDFTVTDNSMSVHQTRGLKKLEVDA